MVQSGVATTLTRIQAAPARGAERVSLVRADLHTEWGIAGDAYGGPGDRQVVLLDACARAAIDEGTGEQGVCYPRFRENLLIEDLNAGRLAPGMRLVIGTVVLEVTAAGKRCFPECTLPRGECHIRAGVAFCRVIRGGSVQVGDDVFVENA